MVVKGAANKEVWVWADLRNERLFGFSLNVLAKARELAEAVSGSASAVIMGSTRLAEPQESLGSGDNIPMETAAQQCVAHGAHKVYVLDNPSLEAPRADVYAVALEKAVAARVPMLVLFALTDFGRELAARTARLKNGGLIADCADLRIEKGEVVATCPSWGGQIMAEIGYIGDHPTGFATVQPHACHATKISGEPGSIEALSVDGLVVPENLKLIDSVPELGEHRKLEDADIVVVGGAGLGSSEGFGQVRALSAALGGEVAATRPPVLQHWVEESRLIGQTGKTVNPKLLFSIGTSGAVQYTAGITEAETIVAINRDKNAPIFQVADLGVVADWKGIVPLLTGRIKQVAMRKLADAMSEDQGGTGRSGFGAKVLALRQSHNWSREDLGQSTGQSPEFIAQVENDEFAPPVGFLLKLARALEVEPGTFLRDEEKSLIRDQRAQQFTKRTQSYSYETLTPGAENEHLRAFLITIEPREAHKPVAYKHEGEEFIFLLEGELELTLGSKAHHLKPRESIRFNSDIPHRLQSRSDETTRCLVVLYTP
jgi:electron transfer flavoprotein alpha subunit/transcriptional regulator with XRE-family HTH domain